MACSCSKSARHLTFVRRMISVQSRKCSSTSSINDEEVAKFSSLSSKWWDPRGAFAPLHSLNALRVPLVQRAARHIVQTPSQQSSAESTDSTTARPAASLEGLKILDIGCGGGLLSEPMARLGASVLGLDASQRSIDIARHHAAMDSSFSGRLRYQCGAAEDLPESSSFHIVVASEVIEHVSDQRSFVNTCCRLVQNGGAVVFTTLNKTCLSYALGIVAAESLGYAPPGTHEWEKFISPDDLSVLLMNCRESGSLMRVELCQGLTFSPLTQRWTLSDSMPINYALVASKRTLEERDKGTAASSDDNPEKAEQAST
ncbi:ubiquinone biosynthesis O-methyltransferase-like [Sycon ciliatum]|uniref:ubiquinone biosynthesis O-methyltransferase-like n=1 Tax=Sycon ciliatum TaxID=27933 RepID=UPI0031F65350